MGEQPMDSMARRRGISARDDLHSLGRCDHTLKGRDTAHSGPLILTVLFSGIAAMAFIETMKRMLPLRAAFQRREVRDFIEREIFFREPVSDREDDSNSEHQQRQVDYLKAMKKTVDETFGRPPGTNWSSIDSAFNLPAEQLVAQIGASIDVLASDYSNHSSDAQGLGTFAGDTAILDRLQIRLAARWRHYIQATAIWLSGFIALAWSLVDAAKSSAVPVIGALLFGGFVAWVSRDIVAVIEGWRR
jgi:hypothetical protein